MAMGSKQELWAMFAMLGGESFGPPPMGEIVPADAPLKPDTIRIPLARAEADTPPKQREESP
jgi:hypothetical protein